ncbi:GDSL esterase/lipase At5g03610-like isoform X1 [Tasmannia lanceolata]|uniref:GDSL esterase/lipase At5g03610-like isoform X1 n=1 Tax=Tasmannia lanceolata TaxID=3420 RepID=UPI0040634067
MEKEKFLCFYLFFVLLIGVKVKGSHHHDQKLFVFGDSYADTGNWRTDSRPWKEPYGITFPGKPSGRWADGRVLTDYLASFLGIRSPVPYKLRKIGLKLLRYGMNFAYGGMGVFDTLIAGPNLTTQIDLFQQMVQEGVYTKNDVNSSMALVSFVGNDYYKYIARNGTLQGLPGFATKLINQLALDLKCLNDLGVKKIAITGIVPVGCLPNNNNMASLQRCNETLNQASIGHNVLLGEAIAKLNKSNKDLKITILDLYQAFISILQSPSNQGKLKFENPLKPCCEGINSNYYCGSIDENGKKMYTVCEKPDSYFFWDTVHPSQQGWSAITASLQSTFNSLS